MDNQSIPDFISLPFYQQTRVTPNPRLPSCQPILGIQPKMSRKRKRSKEMEENLNHCIQESLGESRYVGRSVGNQSRENQLGEGQSCDVSFGGSVVPLPGFDDSLSCKLCCLKTMGGAFNARATGEGASMGEFLNIAHNRFDQEEGRPSMDVAKEIKQSLLEYGERCGIPILREVTDEDVYRHFKFDHTRKSKPKMKDKMLRTLMSMLDVSILTCCEKSEDGMVVINKNDASLTLNIIDRIHKIATLKELE